MVVSGCKPVPCYHPITAYRSRQYGRGGKRLIVFDAARGVSKLQVPCGQCIGCRLERSRQWALRCVHEASLYERNCFITLTYSEECLPADGSLKLVHWQAFMKRLRARFPGERIRFFHCGEYGERLERPHYHACLFNFDFDDKRLHNIVNGHRLYTSDVLSETWGHGFGLIGAVTFESAAYVARYCMKKVTGAAAADHYFRVDEHGECTSVEPEYTTMSRRPGIGREWYERYKDEVVRDDSVIARGVEVKPPRFYDRIYEIEDPEGFARLKAARLVSQRRRAKDCVPSRLKVRESVKEAQLSMLKRGLEDGS